MSAVDYQQTAEDHQTMLVLVRHTGSHLPTSVFNRVWDRIRALDMVHVQGQNRNAIVHYKRSYPVENNEWGDFQAHRKVLGLISVGKCVDHEEFSDLFENYKKVKEEYASTIINSRLIIFGMNTDGSPIEAGQNNVSSSLSLSSTLSSSAVQSSDSVSHCMADSGQETAADVRHCSGTAQAEACAAATASDEHMPFSTVAPEAGVSVVDISNDGADGDRSTESTGLRPRPSAGSVTQEGYARDKTGNDGSVANETRERSGSETCSVTINFGKGSNKPAQKSNNHGSGEDAVGRQGGEVRESDKEEVEGRKLEQGRPHSNSLTKESKGSEVVFYPSLEQCADLEDRLKEFVTSLFYVLEGKRLERTFERSDRLVLLHAPFEKKDYVGVDTETKSYRRRCMGRLRKHLGDLCLQAGLPGEAILHYQTALDMLRSVNDFLWMGGCYEGLSSASVILTLANSKPATPLRRNQSFSVKRGISSPEISQKANSASQFRQQNSLGSYSNGLDHLEQSASQLHCLNPEDIIEKYKEALQFYSKYKHAAIIEIEASMKACRVLIYQRKFLEASDFLQNCVYINLALSEEDKIQHYSTLSTLYGQIGFPRKEAFFRRVAAMQCVTGTNSAWQQCYSLLLQTVEAYNIALDPRKSHAEAGKCNNGWPVIQQRVLHELVYSARRMGNLQLAVRHSTLMLHSLYPYLRPEEQKEMISGLETLTSHCPGTNLPLSTDSGIILPPIHLTMLPTLKSFKVLCPPPHLKPERKYTADDSPSGIFIYTPFSLGTEGRSGNSPDLDFKLVAEDVCAAQLQLVNPLAVELPVVYMGLLTEGLEVEVFPASPTLPPTTSSLPVHLQARPRGTGLLRILGYDTKVFGVNSHCRLRDVGSGVPPHYQVEVVPALPQVTLECTLPKAATFASSSLPEGATVVANFATALYAGQTHDCTVTVKNVSNYPVSSLSVRLDSRSDMKVTDRMFQWSAENVQSQLPIQPGAQLCIALCLYANSDFLLPPVASPDMSSSSTSSRSQIENEKGGQTLEAVLCVEYSGGPGEGAGYCRRCSVAISVDVLPSLCITAWNTKPTSSAYEVTLLLDLLNASSHQVEVQCDNTSADPSPPLTIEPQHCRRVEVTIPRVTFPEQSLDERFESRVPAKYRTWRTADFHSQFLASYTDVQWNMLGEKVKGKVSIEYLKWTAKQLDAIRQPDITWDLTVNGQHYMAPGLLTFAVSEIVTVHISLTAARELHQAVKVTVAPTQAIGQFEHHDPVDPDTCVCLGSCSASVVLLQPEEHFEHSCSFLFLTSGSYKFHISCSTSQSRWTCLPSPLFSVIDSDS